MLPEFIGSTKSGIDPSPQLMLINGSRRDSRMSRVSVTPADIYLEHSHHAVNVEANCDRLSRIRWIRSGSCNGYQGGKDRRWSRCVGLDPDESLDPRMDHAIVG